jgi:hypothetical protein
MAIGAKCKIYEPYASQPCHIIRHIIRHISRATWGISACKYLRNRVNRKLQKHFHFGGNMGLDVSSAMHKVFLSRFSILDMVLLDHTV